MGNQLRATGLDRLKQLYLIWVIQWRTPKLFDGLSYESKEENNGRKRSWGTLPGS